MIEEIDRVKMTSLQKKIFEISTDDLRSCSSKEVEELFDVVWLNTLDGMKINDIIIKFSCSFGNDVTERFIRTLQNVKVIPEDPTVDQWITLFKNGRKMWANSMVMQYRHHSTGGVVRDPENTKEEVLYCLHSSVSRYKPMPSEIVNQLLEEVDLDVVTPDYQQDALSIVCDSGNADYISVLLRRAAKEKGKEDMLSYIQNRYWTLPEGGGTLSFVRKIENLFKELDLPFSETLHGKFDILRSCCSSGLLDVCVGYIPAVQGQRSLVLQKRAFEILCNFAYVDTEDFKKAMEILEREGVDLSKTFQERCEEKTMCLLDKFCLEGTTGNVVAVMSKMTDDVKRKVLTTRNYGERTPLAHANYYSRHDMSKVNAVEEEMKRLGL